MERRSAMAVSTGEALQKPRMREVVAFDAGWAYPYWRCHGYGFTAIGRTAEDAYQSWIRGLPLHGYVSR